MSSQILLIAGIGVALLLMSSQSQLPLKTGYDKGSPTVLEKTAPVQIIKGKRPVPWTANAELPVEMPVFSKQPIPLEQKNHLGNAPYIMPSPFSNLGRNNGVVGHRKMGFYSAY